MNDASASGAYFLSYSRADQDFALRLAADLRANGVAIWIDQLDIRPSEHWDRAIERAVSDCRGLLVVVSPSSAASDNVADEISFAIDHGKTVLPVMIERCRLPLRIARMQVIDATSDYRRALQQCISAISSANPSRRDEAGAEIAKGLRDQQAIASAKRELTAILGPIAAIIVDKEAVHAQSVDDLYTRLATHIADERDRARFTRSPPRATAQETQVAKNRTLPRETDFSIAEAELERIASVLAHYLGPIASVIARRESASAVSAEDFQQRLASRIPDEQQRADFVNRLRKP